MNRPLNAVHSLRAIENVINDYAMLPGGEVITLDEGGVGLGVMVLRAPGYKTALIVEHYVNEMTSEHTIRFYHKLPRKYAEWLEKVENGEGEEGE